jgi:alkaline phosphatase
MRYSLMNTYESPSTCADHIRKFAIGVCVHFSLLLAGLMALAPVSSEGAQARNVILLIGDGMGIEQVKSARLYNGAPLSFETLPFQAQCTTYSANNAITDSGAAGTAIATGIKVNNYVVSRAFPGDGRDLATSLEYSKASGKKVGLITTTFLTHATPATFGAHAADRNDFAEIASDYLAGSKPNILFGGGGNGLSINASTTAGYVVATDTAGFSSLNTTADLLSAQFGNTYMPYEYDHSPGSYPYPHLSDMVAKALSAFESHPDGFFLMVEGGMIDQACHINHLERSVHETIEFARAVQVALDWAQGRADTLILVTADHETGGLAVTQDNGAGNYPEVTWGTTGHTAVNVPVYAWGLGAESVAGILDNTDIHRISLGEPVPVTVNLVGSGSTWRYDATGTDLGSGWRAPGYDDSAWSSGMAQLGYGDGDEQTVIPRTSPVYPCYYFRHTFNVDDPATYTDLSLRILRDDGAVVYLNGTEVSRYSMPSGDISYDTWAATAADYSWDPATVIPNLLVQGANVLAVEIHQGNSTSSDISLDLELSAQQLVVDVTPPVIADLTVSQITDRSALITWTTDEPADSQVNYDDGTSSWAAANLELVTQHSVLLTGLSAATPYSYAVSSTDARGNVSSTANFAFETAAANTPPSVADSSASTLEDTAVGLTLTSSDIENDPLSFRIIEPPSNGILSGTAPDLVYSPNLNYFGPDSFTFVANDGLDDSAPGTVSITVIAVNDPPAAPANLSAVPGDQTVALTWSASSDLEGDSVSYEVYRSLQQDTGYDLVAGSLTTTNYADISVQNGTTYYYIVRAGDGAAWADSSPVAARPAGLDYNAYVIANPTMSYGTFSGDYTATMGDQDGFAQILTESKLGQNGDLDAEYTLQTIALPAQISSLTLRLAGTYTDYDDALRVFLWMNEAWVDISAIVTDGSYTPIDPADCVDVSGLVRVRFTDSVAVRKEKLDSLSIDFLSAEVLVNGSEPVNRAPIAADDTASTTVDTAVAIDVLGNDRDPDNDPLTVSLSVMPTYGSASVNPDQTILYQPGQGFGGEDTFEYLISDGKGGEAGGVVVVTVSQPPGDNTVHVETIEMGLVSAGKNWKSKAVVTILDQSGNPSGAATVVGDWLLNDVPFQTGAATTTDASGVALFDSLPVKVSAGTFIFRVMEVSVSGAAYDPGQDKESWDQISIP